MPRARRSRRYLPWSQPRAAGRCRDRPRRPAITGRASTSGMSRVTSPPVSVTVRGIPVASVIRRCLLPDRLRSTGLGPTWSPLCGPGRARHRPGHATARAVPLHGVRSPRSHAVVPTPPPATVRSTDANRPHPRHRTARSATGCLRYRCEPHTECPQRRSVIGPMTARGCGIAASDGVEYERGRRCCCSAVVGGCWWPAPLSAEKLQSDDAPPIESGDLSWSGRCGPEVGVWPYSRLPSHADPGTGAAVRR